MGSYNPGNASPHNPHPDFVAHQREKERAAEGERIRAAIDRWQAAHAHLTDGAEYMEALESRDLSCW